MFQSLTNLLIPISVCVVLPIWIVWLVMRTVQLRDRQRADIILKAIETNNSIDANQLTEALSKPQKAPRSPLQQLNLRLTIGSIFTFIGVMLSALTLFLYSNDDKTLFIFGIFCIIFLGIGIGFLISFFSMRKYVKPGK